MRASLTGLWRAVHLVASAAPRLFAFGVGAQVLTGVVAAVQVWGIARITSAVMADGSFGEPLAVVMAATLVGVMIDQLRGDQQRLLGECTARITGDRLMAAVAARPLIDFEDPAFADRVARAQTDALACPPMVAGAVLGLAAGAAACLALGGAILAASPVAAVLAVAGLVPLVGGNLVVGRLAHATEVAETHRSRERAWLMSVTLRRDAAAEVRSYEMVEPLVQRHDALAAARIDAIRALVRRRRRVLLAGITVSAACVGAALWVVGHGVDDGTVSVPAAAAALGALVLLTTRISPITAALASLRESLGFLADLDRFWNDAPRGNADAVPPAFASGPAAGPGADPVAAHGPPAGPLRARGIGFTYPGRDTPALVDVDLEIGDAEIVALVGENGAGKSTLVRILAGLILPRHGTVTRGGVALDAGTQAAWRSTCSVVFQEPVRWPFTVDELVRIGAPDATRDPADVPVAAHLDFVDDLPRGWATRLGPEFTGGTDLSGGQWQRLAMARAMYREAPLVLLDEPTANLDPRAEAAQFARIRDVLAGRQALLVTHRFSSCRHADRIVVLDGGRVRETGTHDELVAAGGHYAELFAIQADAFRRTPGGELPPIQPVRQAQTVQPEEITA